MQFQKALHSGTEALDMLVVHRRKEASVRRSQKASQLIANESKAQREHREEVQVCRAVKPSGLPCHIMPFHVAPAEGEHDAVICVVP